MRVHQRPRRPAGPLAGDGRGRITVGKGRDSDFATAIRLTLPRLFLPPRLGTLLLGTLPQPAQKLFICRRILSNDHRDQHPLRLRRGPRPARPAAARYRPETGPPLRPTTSGPRPGTRPHRTSDRRGLVGPSRPHRGSHCGTGCSGHPATPRRPRRLDRREPAGPERPPHPLVRQARQLISTEQPKVKANTPVSGRDHGWFVWSSRIFVARMASRSARPRWGLRMSNEHRTPPYRPEARVRAMSTIMSSCPPTRRRWPHTIRMSRTSTSYRCEATSACRRKLEYTPA